MIVQKCSVQFFFDTSVIVIVFKFQLKKQLIAELHNLQYAFVSSLSVLHSLQFCIYRAASSHLLSHNLVQPQSSHCLCNGFFGWATRGAADLPLQCAKCLLLQLD